MTNHYDFDPMARLRLEVEATTSGLVNLVANPSGASGAWAWVTPVATSVLTSERDPAPVLEYEAPSPAAASFFYTEPLPVVAGQYVGAKWESVFISGYYRARLEWLNAAYAVLSSSTQTAYSQTGAGSIAATLAPANTAFVRLRFDTYSNTSGANPGTNAQFRFRDVVVAKAATSAALGVTRTNLVTNPSFDSNATGWTGYAATVARVTTPTQAGSGALRITAGAGRSKDVGHVARTTVPVTGGKDYNVSAYLRAATTSRTSVILVDFTDANGVAVGRVLDQKAPDPVGAWGRISQAVTAPAGAAFAVVSIGVRGAALGELHYLDSVLVEEGFGLRPYLAGTQANQFLGVIDPGYVNILGPTHDLKIGREGLNLGTLNATILDTALDPATAATLRPGRKVRLMALDNAGIWQALYTGRTSKADVAYDLDAPAEKVSRIALTSVDPNSPLANATRPDGVATIALLPYVLEGCGVPWNVNGSGNQVPTAPVVSTNVNASALDQIAITRDSVSGYAWVDRNGVLQAHDRDLVPAAMPRSTGTGSRDRFDVSAVQGSGSSVTTMMGDTAQFRSAPDSFRVTSPTGGVQYAGFALNAVPVAAGRSYRFRGYVRSAATARQAAFYVTYNAGGVINPLTFTGAASTTTGWTLVEGTFTAPAGATSAVVGLAVAQGPSLSPVLPAAEVHYFDDLTVAPVLDENVYNPDLGVSFTADDCTNEVVIKNIEWDPADATKSVEVTYGPYRDEPSIKDWDRHAAEFTTHGLSAAQVAALGASILTRNAVPAVRVDEVTIPIKSPTDLSSHALLDLYGLVYVKNTARGLDHAAFITGIDHVLTANGWLMTLTFASSTSVAAPTVTPPVQSSGLVSGWQYPTLVGGWANYGAGGFQGARFRKDDGWVTLEGLITGTTLANGMFNFPAGYRPEGELQFAVLSNNAIANLRVSPSGHVVLGAGGSTAWVNFTGAVRFWAAGQ